MGRVCKLGHTFGTGGTISTSKSCPSDIIDNNDNRDRGVDRVEMTKMAILSIFRVTLLLGKVRFFQKTHKNFLQKVERAAVKVRIPSNRGEKPSS